MDIPSSAFRAIASVVASIVAGALAFLISVLSKGQKISEFRQNWIDSLRTELSDFIGFTQSTAAHLKFIVETKGHEGAVDYIHTHTEELTEMVTIYHRIKLRLNPKEHSILLAKLDTAKSLFNGKIPFTETEKVTQAVDSLAAESEAVLKREWRRVKRGELSFFLTKYVSLALLALSVLLLFLYTHGHIAVAWNV
ncbi:MAG: hypothetical protein WAV85_06190 [Rhodoferax sp.]